MSKDREAVERRTVEAVACGRRSAVLFSIERDILIVR